MNSVTYQPTAGVTISVRSYEVHITVAGPIVIIYGEILFIDERELIVSSFGKFDPGLQRMKVTVDDRRRLLVWKSVP